MFRFHNSPGSLISRTEYRDLDSRFLHPFHQSSLWARDFFVSTQHRSCCIDVPRSEARRNGLNRPQSRESAMTTNLVSVIFRALAFAATAVSPAFAGATADQWPAYGHDASNMRYSPLRQITPGNVDQLTPAWTFHMRPASLDVAAANPQTDG